MKTIYIYLKVSAHVHSQLYLYNVVQVDKENEMSIRKYVEEFNSLTVEYKKEHPYDIDELYLTFQMEFVKLNVKKLEKYQLQDYFANFVNRKGLSIEPFVIGFNKYLVDDIFKMYKIRPVLDYFSWTLGVLYFANGPSLATVGIFGSNIANHDLTDLIHIVSTILEREQQGFTLFTNDHQQMDFFPQDFRFNIVPIDDYEQPKTEIKGRFWHMIINNANNLELSFFLESPYYEIYQIAKTVSEQRLGVTISPKNLP